MARSRSLRRLAIGSALLVLAAAACSLFVLRDVNRLRHPLESAAKAALGMDVKVTGTLGLGFLPGPTITAGECRVLGDSGEVVLSVKRVRLHLDGLALLTGRVRLAGIELDSPRLLMVRDRTGGFNVSGLGEPFATSGALEGTRVSVADGTLDCSDRASGKQYHAEGVVLDAAVVHVPRAPARSLLPGVVMRADVACRELRAGGFTITDAKFRAAAAHGVIDCSAMTLDLLGGRWRGRLLADLARGEPVLRLTGTLSAFRIERSAAETAGKQRLVGALDLTTDLTMRGRTNGEILEGMDGRLSLQGAGLVLEGSDLDRAFAHYQSSRNFGLADLGAAVFVGPVALALTRSYGIAGLFRGTGGRTPIGVVVSDWVLERGMARAKDVAISTRDHRIALTGGLDLAHARFDSVTIAVVDDRGCALLRQAVHGDFSHPVVQQPEVFGSLTEPVVGLLRRARRLLPGKPCVPFYAGSVPPPRRGPVAVSQPHP